MTNTSSPVFIIGGSRTGSEMLKTMLSASDELDFVDELFLLCPWWLHPDLQSRISKYVGDLASPEALERLVELLYSGVPYGWFFSIGIHEIDRDLLRTKLSECPLNLKNIFRAIMVAHSVTRKKHSIGAKFPLHYSYAERLVEWFPDCRLIHTTRNPKAIYASQAEKYTRAEKRRLVRSARRFAHFSHINIQTTWTARLHNRLKHRANYCLVRYEDVVRRPEPELRRICDFVSVDFVPEMLNPHQYGSSFEHIGSGTGIDPSSLDRWRTSINPLTARSIDLMHAGAYRTFGYKQ